MNRNWESFFLIQMLETRCCSTNPAGKWNSLHAECYGDHLPVWFSRSGTFISHLDKSFDRFFLRAFSTCSYKLPSVLSNAYFMKPMRTANEDAFSARRFVDNASEHHVEVEQNTCIPLRCSARATVCRCRRSCWVRSAFRTIRKAQGPLARVRMQVLGAVRPAIRAEVSLNS